MDGRAYIKFQNRGVWIHSLGPQSPVPGPRLKLAIYDKDGTCLRRMEQVRGDCLDPGYVDFFGSPRCRPAKHEMPVVDIAPDGTQTILAHRLRPHELRGLVGLWSTKHGRKA